MGWNFLLIAVVFIFVYGGINFYIGSNIKRTLKDIIPSINSMLYWIVFWVIALAYVAGRLVSGILPDILSDWLIIAGSYWMAAMIYFILLLLIKDLVRVLDKWIGFIPGKFKANQKYKTAVGAAVIILVIAIIVYGSWNARTPRITRYDLNIHKSSSISNLHIVMVSDVHLGNIVDNGRLNKMVSTINSLNPDVVLMAGDIIDESVKPFVEQQMGETLKLLKTKYGVYSVLGNHEYIGENGEQAVAELKKAGAQVLRDETVMVGGSFYIVGRDDPSGERFSKGERKQLSELLEDIDTSLPVIVLDHRPTSFQEAKKSGADLQLSGHTHNAQIFPGQLITGIIYEKDWGYLREGDFQLVVSSGYGTWGPPVRVGSISEVVDIHLHFIGDETNKK